MLLDLVSDYSSGIPGVRIDRSYSHHGGEGVSESEIHVSGRADTYIRVYTAVYTGDVYTGVNTGKP
jgi:hypothetical protein